MAKRLTPPDSIRGLYVGLNIGFYFANKNTARIYDGHGYERDGVLITDFSNTWLNQALTGTPDNIRRTDEAMDAATLGPWSINENSFPNLMTYRPSFMFGLHLRYMLNADFGFFSEFNGTFPVTVGEFTIQRQNSGNLQNGVFETFQIRGEEQRFFVNLGVHRVLGRKAAERKGKVSSILPYIDLGGSVLFTKFEENFINLGTLPSYNGEVDLTLFYNNQGVFTNEANVLTGAGFGGFGGLGAQITLGRKFTIDIGYVANMQQVKLGELSEFGIQHQIVFKAIYM